MSTSDNEHFRQQIESHTERVGRKLDSVLPADHPRVSPTERSALIAGRQRHVVDRNRLY